MESTAGTVWEMAYSVRTDDRWSKNGVLQRVFEGLQTEGIVRIKMENVCLDSTTVKVHPDGTGALKQVAGNLSGAPEGGSTPKFI